MVSVNLFGNDLDEAAAAFGDGFNYSGLTFRPTEEPFLWSARTVGDDTLTLIANRFKAAIEGNLGSNDAFLVCWTRAGCLSFEKGHQSTQTPMHVPQLMPGGNTTILSKAHNVDLNGLQIDKAFVAEVARGLTDVRFVSFDVAPASSGVSLQRWRRAIDLVAAVILDPLQEPAPMLRHEMSRLVAVSMLETFAYQSTPRMTARAGSEPTRVRVAYEFVEQNAHLPISSSDIANAAGLSVRALQSALRRYRETTPTELLRSVRLARVNAQLRGTERPFVPVAVIARSWGFVHLGRFAAAYHAVYGELPSETQRRNG